MKSPTYSDCATIDPFTQAPYDGNDDLLFLLDERDKWICIDRLTLYTYIEKSAGNILAEWLGASNSSGHGGYPNVRTLFINIDAQYIWITVDALRTLLYTPTRYFRVRTERSNVPVGNVLGNMGASRSHGNTTKTVYSIEALEVDGSVPPEPVMGQCQICGFNGALLDHYTSRDHLMTLLNDTTIDFNEDDYKSQEEAYFAFLEVELDADIAALSKFLLFQQLGNTLLDPYTVFTVYESRMSQRQYTSSINIQIFEYFVNVIGLDTQIIPWYVSTGMPQRIDTILQVAENIDDLYRVIIGQYAISIILRLLNIREEVGSTLFYRFLLDTITHGNGGEFNDALSILQRVPQQITFDPDFRRRFIHLLTRQDHSVWYASIYWLVFTNNEEFIREIINACPYSMETFLPETLDLIIERNMNTLIEPLLRKGCIPGENAILQGGDVLKRANIIRLENMDLRLKYHGEIVRYAPCDNTGSLRGEVFDVITGRRMTMNDKVMIYYYNQCFCYDRTFLQQFTNEHVRRSSNEVAGADTIYYKLPLNLWISTSSLWMILTKSIQYYILIDTDTKRLFSVDLTSESQEKTAKIKVLLFNPETGERAANIPNDAVDTTRENVPVAFDRSPLRKTEDEKYDEYSRLKAADGNLDEIMQLHSQGVNVLNERVLFAAVRGDHVDIVSFLVQNGLDIEDYVINMLIIAGESNAGGIMVYLYNNRWITLEELLYEVAGNGMIELLQYLSDNGVDILYSNTTMIAAASHGQIGTIKYVLSAGSELPDNILDYASDYNQQQVVDFINQLRPDDSSSVELEYDPNSDPEQYFATSSEDEA